MSKGGSQTQTTQLSPQEQQQLQSLWNTANQTSAGTLPGVSQQSQEAQKYFAGMLPGANLGMGALSGNPSDVAKLMNPYQGQVIDAANAQFANNNAMLGNQLDSTATSAGAFGGDRAAVAKGAALGQAQIGENSEIGGLLSGGYSDAMRQAGQLAQLGFGGANALQQAGLANTQIGQQQYMMPFQVQAAAMGATPFQGSSTMTQTPSPWSTVAGDVTTGAGLLAMM